MKQNNQTLIDSPHFHTTNIVERSRKDSIITTKIQKLRPTTLEKHTRNEERKKLPTKSEPNQVKKEKTKQDYVQNHLNYNQFTSKYFFFFSYCFYLVVLQSIQFKILEQACRTRGYIPLVYKLDSLQRSSMVSRNRFKLLTGGK